ncbi:MAG: hypothetical protein V1787_03645 [Candidatus Micrarchaeota archaeon]
MTKGDDNAALYLFLVAFVVLAAVFVLEIVFALSIIASIFGLIILIYGLVTGSEQEGSPVLFSLALFFGGGLIALGLASFIPSLKSSVVYQLAQNVTNIIPLRVLVK